MKKLKTLFSVLLILTLVFSSIPVAFAGEENVFSGFNLRSFGSYPMSEVKDETERGKLVAALADFDFEKDGISYGFYSGDGSWGNGKMKASDYMFYTDITVNGTKYRAVYIKEFRPQYSGLKTSLTGGTQYYQSSNGYSAGEVYYFRFEPLTWRILDVKTGLVICEYCIDSRAFSEYIKIVEDNVFINSSNKSANDYETSDIRVFLNNDFYNTAFSEVEKKIIKESDLGYSDTDSVFLLSSSDINNGKYFPTNSSRKAQNTAYALALGASSAPKIWILRDGTDSTHRIYRIGNSGTLANDSRVDATFTGIRPAMKVNLSENIFISEDGFIYEITDDNTALILGYNGKETQKLVVPSILGGVNVTAIADGAFSEHEEVTKVCLPETLEELGDGIFGDGQNIKSVILCCDEKALNKGENGFFSTARITSHEITGIKGQKATCTENGLTSGSKCSLCGKAFEKQEVISATGHTPAATAENIVLSADKTGGTFDSVVYCSVCKTELSRTKETFIKGDVDNDKRITAADARLTLRASVGLTGDTDVNGEPLDFLNMTREFLAADYDADNAIKSADARSILRISVGLTAE